MIFCIDVGGPRRRKTEFLVREVEGQALEIEPDEILDLGTDIGRPARQSQALERFRRDIEVDAVNDRFRDVDQGCRGHETAEHWQERENLLVAIIIVKRRDVELQTAVEQRELGADLISGQLLLLDRLDGRVEQIDDDREGARLVAAADGPIEKHVTARLIIDRPAPGKIILFLLFVGGDGR